MSKYTLPDGTTTTNEVQYIREWQFTAQRIERALDVTVISSNPGFQIADKDGAVTSIPMWLVRKIIGITEARDEAQRKACWQYARRYGGGNPNAERKLSERHAEFNGWNCFMDYDWKEGGGA